MMCRLAALLLALALVVNAWPAAAASFPSHYDGEIARAAATWLPGIPWRLLKAQYFQESRLNPNSVSPVGAAGLAQFMPATWARVARRLGYGIDDRRLAAPAIVAGAYYMAELRSGWKALADFERHDFAMASYNAGPGHIHKAWVLCGRPSRWRDASPCLARVTGRFAKETVTYVQRIWRWYFAMQ